MDGFRHPGNRRPLKSMGLISMDGPLESSRRTGSTSQPPGVRPLSSREILDIRGPKNRVNPLKAYAAMVEDELSSQGTVDPVATLFLTNQECPFRCVYCDLWKNTTDVRVSAGDIPHQIRTALAQLGPARHIKLYNSGNFFDPQAIPREDYPEIARLVAGFKTVIVENHPRLLDERCRDFADRIPGEFEVAMGLETAHPQVLSLLNKQMTLADFRNAAQRLIDSRMHARAFVLVKPPFMAAADVVEWGVRSIEFAATSGCRVICVIPTRGGNGALEQLAAIEAFSPPTLAQFEEVFDRGLESVSAGVRVFADTWDLKKLATCPKCADERQQRLVEQNHLQRVLPRVSCDTCE